MQASSSIVPLPTAVTDSLRASAAGPAAAVSGSSGTCALYSRGEVLVWQGDGGANSPVVTRTLPYASSGKHYLSLLVDQASTAAWRYNLTLEITTFLPKIVAVLQ